MRSIDVSQYQLALNPSRKTAVRVLVAGPADPLGFRLPLFDLSTLLGYDWIQSWQVSEDATNQVATAQVTLLRNRFGISLSPYVPASQAQALAAQQMVADGKSSQLVNGQIAYAEMALVWPGRRIQIQTQLVPDLAAADPSGVWDTAFDGHIDKLDFGGSNNTATLQCRDLGGMYCQDYFITDQQPPVQPWIGNSDWFVSISWPINLEDFLQLLINNTLVLDYQARVDGGFTLPLTVLVASGWAMLPTNTGSGSSPFIPQESLLQAMSDLVAQIGFDVRFWFDSSSGQFELTLRRQPDTFTGTDAAVVRGLSGATLPFVLTADMFEVKALPVDVASVRNKCRAGFANVTAGDGGSATFGDWQEDGDSENRYGVRAYQMAGDSTGNIQTQQQADGEAAQALNDLSRPWFSPSLACMYLPFVQLGDCAELAPYTTPEGEALWTSPIWCSVRSFTHSGDNKGNAQTTLGLFQVFVYSA